MTGRPTPDAPLKIGTRGSPLALAQAYETRARLMAAHGLAQDCFAVEVITTTGDRIQDRPLKELGGKGLFTREIEVALLAGQIDIAVHSMKDMPVEQPGGLLLDTYLPREDVRDALLGRTGRIADLPRGATVGTSSIRRRSQVLARRPDLKVVEFRGSVQTRLKKLADGVAEATFLAVAGLNRLGLEPGATPLDPDEMLPAVAQGAIGIERRVDDTATAALLAPIHHLETGQQLAAERAFLAALDGSCQTPIAALAELGGSDLTLRGEILALDGSAAFSGAITGPIADGPALGRTLAADLLGQAGPGFLHPHP